MSYPNEKPKAAVVSQGKPESRYATANPQFRTAVKPPAPVKPAPLKLNIAMEGFTYGIPRGKNKV